jgi:hypothetical protein
MFFIITKKIADKKSNDQNIKFLKIIAKEK